MQIRDLKFLLLAVFFLMACEERKQLKEMHDSTGEMNKTTQSMDKTMQEMNATMKGMSQTMTGMNDTMKGMNHTMVGMNGTMGGSNACAYCFRQPQGAERVPQLGRRPEVQPRVLRE
jgi:hypothetical protein